MLCLKTPLASDVSGCFMSEFLQGWQNSRVPLFLPEIRGYQVGGSLHPCEAKSTVPVLWGALSWVWVEPQRPGPVVLQPHQCWAEPSEVNESIAVGLNEVGLGLQWLYRPVKRNMVFWEFSVSSRENSIKLLYLGFTGSLLLLILFQQVLGKLKSKGRWQSLSKIQAQRGCMSI